MAPLLSFKNTFDTTITIWARGMEKPAKDASAQELKRFLEWVASGVVLPIHVARLSRSELKTVTDGYRQHCIPPRGKAPERRVYCEHGHETVIPGSSDEENERALEAWRESKAEAQFAYYTEVIEKYVTLDEGVIDIDGAPVTKGQGIMQVFHGRMDVLDAFAMAVISENRLSGTLAKNSKSPSDTVTSSEGSALEGRTGSGKKPELIATNVGSSTSAPLESATDKSESNSDEPKPSSATSDPESVR